MNYLDQFRTKYPDYDDLSDQEVLDGLYKNHYSDLDRKDFDTRMSSDVPVPVTPDDEGEIDAGTAFGLGVDIIQQAGGSTLEGIGKVTGFDWLRDQGAEIAENQKAEMAEATGLQGFREIDGVGDTAEFALETIAQQLPVMAPALAGAAVGGKLGAVLGPKGALLGAVGGGILAGLPIFFGMNRERQKEVSGSVQSEGTAFLGALGQSALESVLGAVTFGLGKYASPAMGEFFQLGGGVLTRATKGGAAGALIEMPTEIGQQVIERAQAGLPVGNEEAALEYIDAAGAAFFAGGGFGSTTNVVFGDRETLSEKRARTNDDKLRADLETVLGDVNVNDLNDSEVMDWAEGARADDPLIDYILSSTITDPLKARVVRRRLNEVFTGVLTEEKAAPTTKDPLLIEGKEQLALPNPRDVREETVVAREGPDNVTLFLNDQEVIDYAEGMRANHPLIDTILNADLPSNIKVRQLRRGLSKVISASEAEVNAEGAEIAAGDYSVDVGVGGIAPGADTTARRVDAGGNPVRAEDILEQDRAEAAEKEARKDADILRTRERQQDTKATAEAGMAATSPPSPLTDKQFETQETARAGMSAILGQEQGSTLGPEGVAAAAAGTSDESSAVQRVNNARSNINGLLQKLTDSGTHGAEAARAFRERIEQRGISGDQALGMLRGAEAFAEVAPDAANIRLKFLDTITVGDKQWTGGRLLVGENGLDSIIRVALFQETNRGKVPLTSERIRATGAHEAFHVVQDLYKDVDPGAANIINRTFGKRGESKASKDLPSGVQRLLKRAKFAEGQSVWDALGPEPVESSELQAHSYEAYNLLKNQGKKVPGLGGALSRYMLFNRNFFTKLGNSLRGDGYRSLDDVFENVPTTSRQIPEAISEPQTGLGVEQASTLGTTTEFQDNDIPIGNILDGVDVSNEQASVLSRKILSLEKELPNTEGYTESLDSYINEIKIDKTFQIPMKVGGSVVSDREEVFDMRLSWYQESSELYGSFTVNNTYSQRRTSDPAEQAYNTKVALTTFPYAGALLSRAMRLSNPRWAYFTSSSQTGSRSRIYTKVSEALAEEHGYDVIEFNDSYGNGTSHYIVRPDVSALYNLISSHLPDIYNALELNQENFNDPFNSFEIEKNSILKSIEPRMIDGLKELTESSPALSADGTLDEKYGLIGYLLNDTLNSIIGYNPLTDINVTSQTKKEIVGLFENVNLSGKAETTPLPDFKPETTEKGIVLEQASVLARTMADLDQRIPQALRVASSNPRAPLRENSWTSMLGGSGNGFNGNQSDINRAWAEAIDESDRDDDGNITGTAARDAVKEVGARPPNAAEWNTAFKLPNRVRYWYEASADAFQRLTNFRTPEALSRFIDIVAGTSGGVEPYPNLMRAIGVAAEDTQGVPIRTDLRDPASATKAIAPQDLDSLKFGNFAGTMQFISGLTEKAPLSTNDVQVASAFGFPGTQLASKQVLYEVLSRFYIKLRDVQNSKLAEGEQPYESWQIQALGWVMERGKKKESKKGVSDDYGEALPRIISNIEAQGIDVPGGRLTEDILADPRLPDLMSGTRQHYVNGRFATVETASELTADGKDASETYEYMRTLDESTPWVRDAKKQYVRLQRIPMEAMARRKSVKGGPTKPSFLSDLVTSMVGQKVEIGRVDPRLFKGWGTFESVMSPNLRIPMFYRVQSSGDYMQLTPLQRRAILGMLGKALGQKAMAASKFDPTTEDAADTFRLFVQTTDPVSFNPATIEALEQDLGGYPLNIEEVANGYLIDINVGGFESKPTRAVVESAAEKHFANEVVKISPMSYASDYIEDSGYVNENGDWVDADGYDSYINELLESYEDANRNGDRPRGVGKNNRGAVNRIRRDLARHAETANKIAKERDDGFRGWSNGVRDRLAKTRRQEADQSKRAANRRTKEILNAARDVRQRFTTTGEQASAIYNPIFAANTQPRGVLEYLTTNKFLEPFRSRKEFVRQFVNGFDPIANLELKVNSGKLRDATRSAFKMAELSMQMTGRTEGMLMNGPPVFDPQTGEVRSDTTIGGIQDIFEPIGSGGKYLQFSDYAYARRADELIKDPNTKPDVRKNLEDSFPAAQRQQALALGTTEFDAVIDNYKRFNDTLLQYLVDTGLVSVAQRDAMARTSIYVPFYKLAEEDAAGINSADVLGPNLRSGLSNPDAGLKTLTGKGGQIGDLYTNVIQNAQTFLGAGLRNEAMARTINMMDEAGIGTSNRTAGPTTVTYKVDGNDQHWDIFAPDANGNIDPDAGALLSALSSFSRPKAEGVMKLMESVANVFRTGITLAPGFMLANFIRGDLAGWVSTDGNIRPLVDSAIGLRNVLKNDASTVELKELSGIGGYAFGGRPQEFSNKLKRRLRKDEDIVGVTTKVSDVLGNIFDKLTFVGEATELATREAIYRRLRESGATNLEAAYQGLALINYGRKGSQDPGAAWAVGQILPLIPFLNARIQGLYRTGSALTGKEANAKATALKGLALMGATTALYALSSSDERWDEEPIERRLNYYIIYAGDKKILIPKPFEVGAIFSTLPEFLLDTIRGNTSLKDAEKAAALTFMNTFAFNPVPQAAKPLFETWTNYDFFSGRELETSSQRRLMPGDRATATTSQAAMAIGGATNISPIKIEKIVNGYLGSMGSLALSALDTVLAAAGAIPKQPAGIFGNEPADAASYLLGLRRFVKQSPDPANRWVGEFYELKREVDEIYNSMQDLRKNGEVEAAMALYKNNKGKLRWRDSLGKMQRNMADLNRIIRSTKRNRDMSPDEKRTRLNRFVDMRNNLAQQTERMLQGA